MEINTIKPDETKKERAGKVIRSIDITKEILRIGWESVRVMDVKRDRTDPTGKGTCLVFLNDENFQKVFTRVLEERKAAKNAHDVETQQKKEIDELKEQIEELKKLVASKEE